MKYVALITLLKMFPIAVLGVPLSIASVRAEVLQSEVLQPQRLIVAQQTLPQLSPIEDAARRWTIRLSSGQEIYYQRNGSFSKDIDKILDLYSKSDQEDFEKLDKYYNFTVRETPQALYIYAVPRSSDLRGYTSGKLLRRFPNRDTPLEFVANYGCRASQKGSPAEEPMMVSGGIVCADPTTANNPRNPNSAAPKPSTNPVVNEVKRVLPRAVDRLLR
jgi:hypothetical protein